MARSQNVEISGRKWRVEVAPRALKGAWGKCFHGDKLIVLCPTAKAKGIDRETFIHEFTHGAMWFLDEDCVKEFAIELDDYLDEPVAMSRHRRMLVLLRKNMPFLTARCRLQFAQDLGEALDALEL